jgi:hypothetical protein
MTMPSPIVVVPVTLGQIDAVVETGLLTAPAPEEPVPVLVPVLVPPDIPGMPDMEPEPPAAAALEPCGGAATEVLPVASVRDVAPRTSTAAMASADAAPHHNRPALPMACQRARTLIMKFRMTTSSFSL